MEIDDRVDDAIFKVVVNHEEQYSIWPADRETPLGWTEAGKQGTREDCDAYIKEVWKDMPDDHRHLMEDEKSNLKEM